MKNAPATAAFEAPNAVQAAPAASNDEAAQAAPAPQQKGSHRNIVPAWLTMTEADFEAMLVKNKLGTKSKRAEEMRARRADFAAAEDEGEQPAPGIPSGSEYATDKPPRDPDLLPQMFDQSTSNEVLQPMVPELLPRRRKTKAEVVQAAIALDKAPPDALRTRFIDPKMIDIQEGWNARFDYGDVEELAASIKAQKALDGHGLINDIRVKEKADGRYALVDGERRLHSVLHLISQGEEFAFGIPAKVEAADAEDSDLLIKMFTANMGKAFLPIEEAHYYKRLRDQGLTIAQIEEKTGRSDNSIVGALALLEGDEDLYDAVLKGHVSGTLGKSIAVNVRGDKERQRELVAKAKAAKKDPKAMKAVKKEIDEARKAKFKKRTGKEAKGRFDQLTPQELAELGTQVGLLLKQRLDTEGMSLDADLTSWVASEPELQLAATFGALQALKAAAGVKVDVKFSGKKGD